MEQHEAFRPTQLNFLMILIGSLLGTIVCISNMYFGLRIGSISTMSASTALLGFAIFKIMSPWVHTKFSPTENVVLQTIASSVASMPISASLWSVIPAIEYLKSSEEGDPRSLTILELTIWSLGVCFLGTIFSAPFREYFILRQKLKFPSPHAVGILIGTLHNDETPAIIAAQDRPSALPSGRTTGTAYQPINPVHEVVGPAEQEQHDDEAIEAPEHYDWLSKIMIILKFSAATACYLLLSFVLPVIDRIPVFGTKAASWLWFLSLSPALVAFGVILDLSVACSMFVGAVIGWGILSPIAKYKKWAPGPVDDMESGARGWLIWITIGLLLGDALMRVLCSAIAKALNYTRSAKRHHDAQNEDESGTHPFRDSPRAYGTIACESSAADRTSQYVSNRTLLVLLLVSSLLCIAFTSTLYGHEIPFYTIVLAIIITLPMCIIVIQTTGETDAVPSNNLSNACQFLFGLVVPQAGATELATMILGAITEAGLWQSAVLMCDLKTAYLLQASPRVMFKAQLLGSLIGTVVGSCIYRLCTLVYKLPNENFPMPMAHLWMNTARLVSGGSLPPGAPPFLIGAMALAAFIRLLNIISENKPWHFLLPSVFAMSVALLVPPSITLSKLIGAGLRILFLWLGVAEIDVVSAAIGCILTEGTLGFVPVLLADSV